MLTPIQKITFCEALISTQGYCSEAAHKSGLPMPNCIECPVKTGDGCPTSLAMKRAEAYLKCYNSQDKDNVI